MITIVSGLPRSGTSMMMQMLAAGGIEPVIDGVRHPDEDNPKGYFELEQVKKTKIDKSWLDVADGKSVKVISQLLFDLPLDKHYKVLFMRRNLSEILASQSRMITRRGTKGASLSSEKLGEIYAKHLNHIAKWLSEQKTFEVLYIDYHDVINDAISLVKQVCEFLEDRLDEQAMVAAVDPTLYRQKVMP